MSVKLLDVGKLPVIQQPISQASKQTKQERYAFNGPHGTNDRNSSWPMFITAGDISKDGGKIVLRTYNGNIQIQNFASFGIT